MVGYFLDFVEYGCVGVWVFVGEGVDLVECVFWVFWVVVEVPWVVLVLE